MSEINKNTEKHLKWIAQELFKANSGLDDFNFETSEALFIYLKNNYESGVITDETLDKIFLTMGNSGQTH